MLRENEGTKGTSFPEWSDSITKTKPIVVIKYTRTFTRGLPHELKLFTSTKLLILYKLLGQLGGIYCQYDRRRRMLFTPRRDHIRLS